MDEQEEIKRIILLALRSGRALSVEEIFNNPEQIHYDAMDALNRADIVASEPNRKFILR